MKSCKKPENPEMVNEKQITSWKKLWKAYEKHGKVQKLVRNLGKDMKSSKKQMKSLEKISNADEKCIKAWKAW